MTQTVYELFIDEEIFDLFAETICALSLQEKSFLSLNETIACALSIITSPSDDALAAIRSRAIKTGEIKVYARINAAERPLLSAVKGNIEATLGRKLSALETIVACFMSVQSALRALPTP